MLRDLFLGAVLPGLLAVLVLAALRPWRDADEDQGGPRRALVNAIAIVGSFTVAWSMILGLPELLPIIARDRTWSLVAVAGVVSILGTRGALIQAVAVAAIGAWTLLSPAMPRFSAGVLVLMGFALVATAALNTAALAHLTKRRGDPRPALVALAVWGGGVAATLVLSATASGGQLLGGLVAALSGVLFVGLRFPQAISSHTAILTGVIGVTTSLWAGYLYAEMSVMVLVVASLPPLLALGLLRFKASRLLVSVGLTATLVGLPIGVAGGLAALDYFDDAPVSSETYDPYADPDTDSYDPYAGSTDDEVDYP